MNFRLIKKSFTLNPCVILILWRRFIWGRGRLEWIIPTNTLENLPLSLAHVGRYAETES